MPDTNETNELSPKLAEDIEKFLFELTGGSGETAIVFMAAAELYHNNPRLLPLIVKFQHYLREEHTKTPGHEDCTHAAYGESMYKALDAVLPYTSEVRDYIDFKVD